MGVGGQRAATGRAVSVAALGLSCKGGNGGQLPMINPQLSICTNSRDSHSSRHKQPEGRGVLTPEGVCHCYCQVSQVHRKENTVNTMMLTQKPQTLNP